MIVYKESKNKGPNANDILHVDIRHRKHTDLAPPGERKRTIVCPCLLIFLICTEQFPSSDPTRRTRSITSSRVLFTQSRVRRIASGLSTVCPCLLRFLTCTYNNSIQVCRRKSDKNLLRSTERGLLRFWVGLSESVRVIQVIVWRRSLTASTNQAIRTCSVLLTQVSSTERRCSLNVTAVQGQGLIAIHRLVPHD
jgi:hypothetical protein